MEFNMASLCNSRGNREWSKTGKSLCIWVAVVFSYFGSCYWLKQ